MPYHAFTSLALTTWRNYARVPSHRCCANVSSARAWRAQSNRSFRRVNCMSHRPWCRAPPRLTCPKGVHWTTCPACLPARLNAGRCVAWSPRHGLHTTGVAHSLRVDGRILSTKRTDLVVDEAGASLWGTISHLVILAHPRAHPGINSNDSPFFYAPSRRTRRCL